MRVVGFSSRLGLGMRFAVALFLGFATFFIRVLFRAFAALRIAATRARDPGESFIKERGDIFAKFSFEKFLAGDGALRAGEGALRAGEGALRAGDGALRAGEGALRAGEGALRAGDGVPFCHFISGSLRIVRIFGRPGRGVPYLSRPSVVYASENSL
jgi:hypothetical protein